MWALSRSTDLYRALTVDRGGATPAPSGPLNDAIARVLFPDSVK